ncbi:N-acetylglucosamine kinase [Chloroflexota bacterium]
MPTASSPQLFIGVDGGQSATLTVLVNESGEILASALTGPCNHIHEPGGLERQYKTLRAGYEQVLAAVDPGLASAASVYLGLTGGGHLPTVTSVYETDNLTLTGDTVSALAGAIPTMIGTIIIAGTGSVAYGRNAQGVEATVGGRGWFAGDEGSSYDIARRGHQAVYQAADGRGPQTLLSAMLLAHYACADLDELCVKIYSGLSRDQLARTARIVGKAAAQGDPVATQIMAAAGEELGRAVAAVLRRLGMVAEPTPIAPIGGVFKAGEHITTPLLAHVHKLNDRAHIIQPRFVPAIGAAILALRAAGLTIDETILNNLERTGLHLPMDKFAD